MEIGYKKTVLHPPICPGDCPGSAKKSGRWDITALPVELVEKISAHLSIRDISACRLVSKSWKNLMDDCSIPTYVFYRSCYPLVPFAHSQKTAESDYLSIRNWLRCFSDWSCKSVERLDTFIDSGCPNLRRTLCYTMTAALAHGRLFNSKSVCTIQHQGPIVKACFSADGDRFASVSRDETVQIWGQVEGKWQQQTTIQCSRGITDGAGPSFLFSPDSDYVACPYTYKSAQILGYMDGQWQQQTITEQSCCVWGYSFSPDRRHFAYSTTEGDEESDKVVQILEHVNGVWQRQQTISYCGNRQQEQESITQLRFSPEGDFLVIMFDSENARVLRCVGEQWQTQRIIPGCYWGHISFSPDGRYLVVQTTNKIGVIWVRASGDWRVHSAIECAQGIDRIRWNGRGGLVVKTDQCVFQIWEFVDQIWQMQVCFPYHQYWLDLSCSPDGIHFAMATDIDSNAVIIWALTDGQLQERAKVQHTKKVIAIDFSFDGRHLLTASLDKTVKIWGHMGGRWWEKECIRHPAKLYHAQFSPNGTHVLSTCEDFTTHLWMLQSQEQPAREDKKVALA